MLGPVKKEMLDLAKTERNISWGLSKLSLHPMTHISGVKRFSSFMLFHVLLSTDLNQSDTKEPTCGLNYRMNTENWLL